MINNSDNTFFLDNLLYTLPIGEFKYTQVVKVQMHYITLTQLSSLIIFSYH